MKCISVLLLSAAVSFAQGSPAAGARNARRAGSGATPARSSPTADGRASSTSASSSTADSSPPVGFTTGQAARLVIGQPTFTAQDTNSSDIIVGGVSGLAYAADTLFVADSNRVGSSPNNHRVLLYQNLSGMLPSPTATLTY